MIADVHPLDELIGAILLKLMEKILGDSDPCVFGRPKMRSINKNPRNGEECTRF